VSTTFPAATTKTSCRSGVSLGRERRRKIGRVGTTQAPHIKGLAMSDKSPRQTMTKKSGKSLKEKRAAKQAKAAHAFSTEALLNVKKR
jgi:hypothetical protein